LLWLLAAKKKKLLHLRPLQWLLQPLHPLQHLWLKLLLVPLPLLQVPHLLLALPPVLLLTLLRLPLALLKMQWLLALVLPTLLKLLLALPPVLLLTLLRKLLSQRNNPHGFFLNKKAPSGAFLLLGVNRFIRDHRQRCPAKLVSSGTH
jgi:hypothetical protein